MWYFPDPPDGNHTPAAFAAHVQDAITWMNNHPSKTTAEKIMMLYAWNEYGEGGYIAPTLGDPNGLYLDALASVLGVPNLPRSCCRSRACSAYWPTPGGSENGFMICDLQACGG